VQLRGGRWYKREDLFQGLYGVNGAKLRACQHLIGTGRQQGKSRVISAASVLSPQNAMAAVTAKKLGMACTVVLGGTKPESAIKHRSVQVALANGAQLRYIKVGYNPALQRAAADLHAEDPDSYWLRYGITAPPGSDVPALRAFHETAGRQVANLPEGIRTLVLPFGSGNTGAGVLYGLSRQHPKSLEKIVLIGIGPDRREWLKERLHALGAQVPVPIEHHDLHGTGYATYSDKMPETLDGIALHPTYEGKVARYLNERRPDWWTRRDESTCLWIVGGPLKEHK
jgi:D-cysteine desulfhydrase